MYFPRKNWLSYRTLMNILPSMLSLANEKTDDSTVY